MIRLVPALLVLMLAPSLALAADARLHAKGDCFEQPPFSEVKQRSTWTFDSDGKNVTVTPAHGKAITLALDPKTGRTVRANVAGVPTSVSFRAGSVAGQVDTFDITYSGKNMRTIKCADSEHAPVGKFACTIKSKSGTSARELMLWRGDRLGTIKGGPSDGDVTGKVTADTVDIKGGGEHLHGKARSSDTGVVLELAVEPLDAKSKAVAGTATCMHGEMVVARPAGSAQSTVHKRPPRNSRSNGTDEEEDSSDSSGEEAGAACHESGPCPPAGADWSCCDMCIRGNGGDVPDHCE